MKYCHCLNALQLEFEHNGSSFDKDMPYLPCIIFVYVSTLNCTLLFDTQYAWGFWNVILSIDIPVKFATWKHFNKQNGLDFITSKSVVSIIIIIAFPKMVASHSAISLSILEFISLFLSDENEFRSDTRIFASKRVDDCEHEWARVYK